MKLKEGDKIRYKVVVEYIIEETIESSDLEPYYDDTPESYIAKTKKEFEYDPWEINAVANSRSIISFEGSKV